MKTKRNDQVRHAREERERKRRRRQENRRIIAEDKQRRGCELCGQRVTISILHYHHRDPRDKNRPVSSLVSSSNEAVRREIAKCRLWCRGAHAHYHRTGEIRRCPQVAMMPVKGGTAT